MDQLYEMARTVVVVSSQLITTLSALAYLRNRNINGTDLRVLSLERLDHVHAAHPFEDVLFAWLRVMVIVVFLENSALCQQSQKD